MTKRPVETRGIFHGISQYARMYIALAVQGLAYHAYAPVHHVGWRYDIDARLGIHQSLTLQHRDCFVVQHVTRLVDHAVLAVTGIGIEGHIGDNTQFRKTLLQRFDGARDEPLGIDCFAPVRSLEIALNRRKEGNSRYAQLDTKRDLGE